MNDPMNRAMNPSEKGHEQEQGNEQKGISRRHFVKDASVGAAAIAGALSAMPAQAQQSAAPGVPARWDLEADVVVIGSERPGCRRRFGRGTRASRFS